PVEGDRHIQQHAFIETGVGSKLAIRVGRPLTLRAQLGWRGGTFTQREDLIDDVGRTFATRRQLDASQHAAHAALGLTWRPLTALRIEAGGRFDLFAASGTDGVTNQAFSGVASALSPRLQIIASPNLDWEIFAAYGRGLRSPEARAFSGSGADVTVADNAEVGARFTPSDAFSVGLATFWVGIERETIFDHAAAVTVQQGATRRVGGEIDLRWDALHWLRLDADLALARGRFVNPSESFSGRAEVPNAPQLLATIGSTVTHPTGWEASLHVLWLGARPLAFGATAGDAVMVDTGVGYRWSAVRLRLDVENPLNRQVREGEAQFASRWNRDQPGGQLPAIHYFAAAPLNARFTATAWF
ncbi:MAG: outer membrane receptor protein involved in Fe transport, partial [Bradymonadia bacterium]